MKIQHKQQPGCTAGAKLPVVCCSCGLQESFCFMPVSDGAALVFVVFFFIYLALIPDICVLSGGRFLRPVSVFVLTSRYSPAAVGGASVAVACHFWINKEETRACGVYRQHGEKKRMRQEIHHWLPQETAEVFSRRAIPRMSDVCWDATWARLKAVGLLPSCILTALIFYHSFSLSARENALLLLSMPREEKKKGSERKVWCWGNESHSQITTSSCAKAAHDIMASLQ